MNRDKRPAIARKGPIPSPKPPRTTAQQEASRNNGSKSNGPITPEGKSASSKNAIRHGLTATEHTLLMTEDPAQYKEVIDSFVDDLRPATKAELRLVEKIGNLDWRLERLVMMETCVLNLETGVCAQRIMDTFINIDGIGFIVEAWKESRSASQCLELLRRYMGTLQHQFNTTLSNFHKFEKRRLEQRLNRDLDPAFLPPYQRPALASLDPAAIPNEPKPLVNLPGSPQPAVPKTLGQKLDTARKPSGPPEILRPAA